MDRSHKAIKEEECFIDILQMSIFGLQMHIRIRANNNNIGNVLPNSNKEQILLKKQEKIADVILDKEKRMVIGKLRTSMLIRADL